MEWIKKNMKKLIIAAGVLVLLVLVIFIFGSRPVKVGFLGMDMDAPEMVQLRERLEKKGYEICIEEDAQALAKENCTIWVAKTRGEVNAEETKAAAGEIPVVFTGRKPYMDSFYVGRNMELAGRLMAQAIGQLPNKGDNNGDGVTTCLIVCGPADHWDSIAWEPAVRNGIIASEHPMKILNTISCADTQEGGNEAVGAELARLGRDLEVVLTVSDNIALGAAQAISSGGWKQGEDNFLISVAANAETEQAMQNGQMSALVYANGDELDSYLYQAIGDALNKKTPKAYILENTIIYPAK